MKTQPPIRKILVVPLLLAFGLTAQAQTIAIEDFDGGTPSWTNDHASLLFQDPSTASEGLFVQASDAGLLNNGTNALFGRDINGETGEPSASNSTITFSDVDVSASTGVVLSFDHALDGFDSTDDINWVVVIDRGLGTENLTFATGNIDASETGTVIVNIPDTATTVGLEVTLIQNGGDEFELDNFKLEVPAADVTAPLLSSSSPADDSTDAFLNQDLSITFDEDIQAVTGNITLHLVSDDSIVETFDVTTDVSITDETVTLTPSSNLTASTAYYINIAAGSIEDIAGNDFAGIADTTTLNFTTSTNLKPAAGDIVINEILQNPAAVDDSAGEWFEVYNASAAPIDLNGWIITTGTTTHTISSSVIIPAGDYAVLGENDDTLTNGGVTIDYEYSSSLFLGNGSMSLILTSQFGEEIDRVDYDGGATFPDPTGASMALISPALDNNVGSSWTTSTTPFGAGDLGTPGADNGLGGDTTPPAIVTLSPVDDAPAVLTIENLQIFFDEDIQAGTGNIEIYELGNGTPVQTIDIATATISGSAIQISPANLTAGTDHYVLIDSGAIEDLLGNAFTGISDTTAWSFTTVSGTLITDEAIRTGDIDTAANGGGTTSDSFSGQSTSGGNFNDYGVAEFDMSFENFSGNSVTDILSANLLLTIDDPFFAATGDFVILFTTDSVGDLSSAVDYDQLEYDDLSTNGIDATDFTYTPVQVGSGSFSETTPGGFTEVVEINLATIKADLITAINNRDSFHFIIGSVDSDSGAVTFSGVGNNDNPGAPTLALTATTGAPVAAINITESAGSTDVDETGPTSDSFDVVLNAAPTATITVAVTPDSQVTVDSPTLTFTTGDWFTPQTVTVTAVDDALFEDATHSGSVSLTASGDVAYSTATNSVSVSIVDNDFGASDAVINEFVADNEGTDDAYIEIYGSPSTDYSSLYILEIEGDSSSPTGNIDAVFQVGTTDANGFWLITDTDNTNADAENGTITFLLVQGFTGSVNDDIDTNDDGIIDNAPWSSIIDGVASFEGGTDIVYVGDSAVVNLDVGYDDVSGQVGGASRIPDGQDTDTDADWVRNDFNKFGLPDGPAEGTDGQAENTPGESNQVFFDVTAPTISTLTPADDSTIAVLADNLVATFSEDIQEGTGIITLHLSSDDSIVESFDVTTDAIVFGNTLELNPTADLIAGVGYYVQIPAGALTDTAGTPNAFAGIAGATGWNFINLTLLSSEDFSDPIGGDADDWFNATVIGDDPWEISIGEATIDGTVNPLADEHYLVSPALDLTSESSVTISFDYSGGFDDSDPDSFELVYSTDYSGSGDPEASATWTEITFDFSQNLQGSEDGALDLINSGLVSIPATLDGEPVVYLAFRYSADGTLSGSENWFIDNILVQSVTSASTPLDDYLTLRGLDSGDLDTDTNDNGFTVLEEYLAGFGDGAGTDAISYGVDTDGTLALTLTSDLELEPDGITVVLEATSDLGVAFAPVAFTTSVVDNLDGTFTRSYTETTPPAGDQRFLRLDITVE